MTAKGSEPIFISRILRDGSGVELINKPLAYFLNNDDYQLIRLSIKHGTYIATDGNFSYVVKKKPSTDVNARLEQNEREP